MNLFKFIMYGKNYIDLQDEHLLYKNLTMNITIIFLILRIIICDMQKSFDDTRKYQKMCIHCMYLLLFLFFCIYFIFY